MSERDKKKQIAKISVFITSIFVIFLSITYAFINVQLTGTKKQVITAGTLSLELEEDNEITITDALPMYDEVGMIQSETYDFRLVNKGSVGVNYEIMLHEVETGTLSKSDVRYGLIKEGETTIDYLSNIKDNIIDSGAIAGGDTHEYTLRLWIRSDLENIQEIQGKTLTYRLSVEAGQTIEVVKSITNILDGKVDDTTIPTFAEKSNALNGRGIYKYQEDGEDIYYWRGDISELEDEGMGNHVIFAGMCWEMVRTTKTGGIKMIYDGLPVETNGVQTCPNTGTKSQLTDESKFNEYHGTFADAGYMYGGETYEPKSVNYDSTEATTAGILYGYDVEWDGTNYTLKENENDISEGELYESNGDISRDYYYIENKHRYTCFDTDGSCSTVYYIFNVNESAEEYDPEAINYLELTGGKMVEEVIEEMFQNVQDSTIKTNIETWFEGTDLVKEQYLNMLEDVVFCNDRTIDNFESTGWNKDATYGSYYLYYLAETRSKNGTPDLSCRSREDNRDRFTYQDTKNGNGLLKWPVGLLTSDEIALAGGKFSTDYNTDYYLYTGEDYWTMSPSFMWALPSTFMQGVFNKGNLNYGYSQTKYGVRPVISLKSKVEFVGGNGSSDYPYYTSEDMMSAFTINKNASHTTKQDVQLDFDGTGISEICISNTESCTDYVMFANTTKWTLTPGDGEKTVYVYYKDNDGNIVASMSRTIILDTTGPTDGSIAMSSKGRDITLTLSSTGADHMCISKTSSIAAACTNWVDYATTYYLTLPLNSTEETIYAFFKDEVGNIAGPYSVEATCTEDCGYKYFMDANNSSNIYLMRDDGATAKVSTTSSSVTWYSAGSQEMKVCGANTKDVDDQYFWCVGTDNNVYYKTTYNGKWIKINTMGDIDVHRNNYSIYGYWWEMYLIKDTGYVYNVYNGDFETVSDINNVYDDGYMAVCSGYYFSPVVCVGKDGKYYHGSATSTGAYTSTSISKLTDRTLYNTWIDMYKYNYVDIIESDGTNLYNARFEDTDNSATWYTSPIPGDGIKTCTSGGDSTYNYCLAKDGYLYHKNYSTTSWSKSSLKYE